MKAFLDYIDHLATANTALLAIMAVAVIVNMPVPGSKWSVATLYKWVYDSLQAFISARAPHSSMSSTVTTPTSSSHVEATTVNQVAEVPAVASAPFPTTKP